MWNYVWKAKLYPVLRFCSLAKLLHQVVWRVQQNTSLCEKLEFVFDNITGMFWVCIAARKNSQLSSLFQQPVIAQFGGVCVLLHSWYSYSSSRNTGSDNSTVITCVSGHSMDCILQLSYYNESLKNKLLLEATSLRTAWWGCTLYISMFVYTTNLEHIFRKLQKSQNTEFL